jgi:hypothetical protein
VTPATTAETGRRSLDPLSLSAAALLLLAAVFLIAALVVAVALPYGEWDAMAFGSWSRQIAEHWPHIRFTDVGAASYHRPLFYFLQGTVWSIFGFHQWLGRLLALAFSVVLIAGVAWTTAQTVRVERRLAAALAVVVVVLITPFATFVVSGLSDLPAAALVALTAAVLLTPRLGSFRLPLVGVVAALAVLTKPSSLAALVGLGAAVLLGSRTGLRQRATATAAIAAGTVVGLLYDLVQARFVHMGLRSFLTVGSDGFYANLAASSRKRVLLDGGWLGSELRVLVMFSIAYALIRLAVAHRPAVLAAFVIAIGWSWLGPHLAGQHGVRVGILAAGNWAQQAAVILLAASLLLALLAPAAAIPSRLQLARGLVWATPPFVVWALKVVYADRLLAPAWPALVLLIVWSTLPVFAAARAVRREWLALVPASALIILGAYAVQNVNGLGSSGWRQLRAGGLAGLGNAALMRNVALGGDFSSEINALEPQVGPHDRILSYDQRLRFFYLDQFVFAAPQACTQLQGDRIFVLLESDEVRRSFGARATPGYWDACHPKLTRVDERPGAYAIYINGGLRTTVGGCGAPTPAPGLVIRFDQPFKTNGAATAALTKVVAVGFVQAHVEYIGCADYEIIETGVPDTTVGQSIIDEAKTASLEAELVKR